MGSSDLRRIVFSAIAIVTLLPSIGVSRLAVVLLSCIYVGVGERSSSDEFDSTRKTYHCKLICAYLKKHMLYLGNISYSFYLYHSLVLLMLPHKDVLWLLVSYVTTLVVASLSYYLVERRSARLLLLLSSKSLLSVVSASSAAVLGLLVLSAKGIEQNKKNGWYEWPLEASVFTKIEDSDAIDQLLADRLNDLHKRKRIFVVGDSHAATMTGFLLDIANDSYHHSEIIGLRLNGIYATNLNKDIAHESLHPQIAERSSVVNRVLDVLLREGDLVYLANQQSTWFSETYNDSWATHRLTNVVNPTETLRKEAARELYMDSLKQLALLVEKHKSRLVIQLKPPDFRYHPRSCHPLVVRVLPGIYSGGCPVPRSTYETRVGELRNKLHILRQEHPKSVAIADFTELLCTDTTCNHYNGLSALYYDDHLGKGFYKLYGPKVKEYF